MNPVDRADPSIYPKLRENALKTMRLPDPASYAVQMVLMDWHVSNGTVTVLAAADGTASMYLSSGGGFIGGGQGHPSIREAALSAVQMASRFWPLCRDTEKIDLPAQDEVTFYLRTGAGLRMAAAKLDKLIAGSEPLGPLGGAMQRIVTEYRLKYPSPQSR